MCEICQRVLFLKKFGNHEPLHHKSTEPVSDTTCRKPCCSNIFFCQCFAYFLYKCDEILEQSRASLMVNFGKRLGKFDLQEVAAPGSICHATVCGLCAYHNFDIWKQILFEFVQRKQGWSAIPKPGHPLISSLPEILALMRDHGTESSEIINIRGFSLLENGSMDNSEGFGAFTDLGLEMMPPRTRNIDIGGGKYDDNTDFLRKSYHIDSAVYDPFARGEAHNQYVLSRRPFDMATSISVLNVIKHIFDRYQHIKLMHDSIKPGGISFFKIYTGDRSEIPKECGNFWQNNWSASRYVDEVKKIFGEGCVTLISQKNLIIAQKLSI